MGYIYQGKNYTLEADQQGFLVMHNGQRICRLLPSTQVQTVEETAEGFCEHEDFDTDISFQYVSENSFLWCAKSDTWQKEYVLQCDEEGFNYFVRVTGKGNIGKVNYFADRLQNGKTKGSYYYFCEYYIPYAATNSEFRNPRPSSLPFRSFFELLIPPPYCFSFRTEGLKDRFGLGMITKPGEYNFIHFDYECCHDDHRHTAFCLSTDMEGHTKVDGTFELPMIRGFFGEDDIDIVRNYSEYHYANGLCNRRDYSNAPRWWKGPIVCGWNEQNTYPLETGKKWKDLATQQVYTDIAQKIQEKGIRPTILIVDDKWQKGYGDCVPDPEKWPDMRAFTDEMHARGIHVLLWLRLWGGEGLPEDETMPGEGIPYNYKIRLDYAPYADPTNPKYQAHMREILRTLLSDEEGCMNVDGFKLDYSLVMPYGKPAKSYGGQYGAEMTKCLYRLIYNTAKQIKPDALINASPCHPYFAEVCDEARLHDYNWACRNETEQMSHRAQLFQAAMPGVLIDTDSVNFEEHDDAMRFYRAAPTIGIPDIYQFSNTEAITFTEEDWDEIRAIFNTYADKMDQQG